jgi:hypothetical protein
MIVSMHTILHKKLIKMCSIQRKPPNHWWLVGSKTIWVPSASVVVTTKSCMHAAFVAPVPEGMAAVSGCGSPLCSRPEHLVLRRSANRSRGLSLPEELAALGERRDPRIAELPPGVTTKAAAIVRQMAREGASMDDVRRATGLSFVDVVKLKTGAYDESLAQEGRRSGGAAAAACLAPPSAAAGLLQSDPPESLARVLVADEGDEGEIAEEAEWLELVRRGR